MCSNRRHNRLFEDYLRSEYGCKFVPSRLYSNHPFLGSSGIIEPFEGSVLKSDPRAINCVWKFNPDTHHNVIDSIINEFRQIEDMGENVVQSLELALNEVTDNIIQHSLSAPDEENSIGYVMAQFHRSNNEIAVAVFDYGQGIQSSLKRAKRGLTLQDSIKSALERGVTGGNGAGNGLWMMSQIVAAASGQFSVASGNARYSFTHHEHDAAPYSFFSSFSPIKDGTTLIDFQLDSNARIDFINVLDGYEPTDLWYENHLNDGLDRISFDVRKEARGARSRRSAKAFAYLIINTIKGKPEKCTIDFADAPNMSASFADELILSLVEKLGFVGFVKNIELANLSHFNQMMVNNCMQVRFERK